MRKLLNSKKAVNDVTIITGIISVFILIGLLLPYLNSSLDIDSSDVDIVGLEGELGEETENVSTINAFTILISVLKMFFWTFGALPFWLDAIFTILRITLVITIARNIWIGGGA